MVNCILLYETKINVCSCKVLYGILVDAVPENIQMQRDKIDRNFKLEKNEA